MSEEEDNDADDAGSEEEGEIIIFPNDPALDSAGKEKFGGEEETSSGKGAGTA
jgi:hypothetical protein